MNLLRRPHSAMRAAARSVRRPCLLQSIVAQAIVIAAPCWSHYRSRLFPSDSHVDVSAHHTFSGRYRFVSRLCVVDPRRRQPLCAENTSQAPTNRLVVMSFPWRRVPSLLNQTAPTPAITPFSAAHKSYVQSLYRRFLKNELNWTIRRDVWRQNAIAIRIAFEENRGISNPRELAHVLQMAELALKDQQHPDPYTPPMAEDGTKWERNVPPPTSEMDWATSEGHHDVTAAGASDEPQASAVENDEGTSEDEEYDEDDLPAEEPEEDDDKVRDAKLKRSR